MMPVEEVVSIASERGELEGILTYPEDAMPDTIALLLSPHPNLGGNMHNNVIAAFACRLAQADCVSLRFNYHGVGNSRIARAEASAKEYWAGVERARRYEVLLDDIGAAWDTLRSSVPKISREILVGYSLGAAVAPLTAGFAPRADVVAIAPPVARVDIDGYHRFHGQKVFVTGGSDFAFDSAKFDRLYDPLPPPKNHLSFPGQDHFFRGAEERIAVAVMDALGLGVGAGE